MEGRTNHNAVHNGDSLLLHYWYILQKRRLVVLGFALTLLVTVFVATLLATPYYASTAVVEIRPRPANYIDVEEVAEVVSARGSTEMRAYYATQYRIMRSRSLLAEAIRRLREEHGVTAFDEVEKPVEYLRSLLDVEPDADTFLVKITVEYPDPELAALFANVIAEVYSTWNLQRAYEATQEAKRWLKDQHRQYERRWRESLEKVQAFRSDKGLLGVQEERQARLRSLAQVQQAWDEAHTRRVEVEAVAEELRRLAASKGWAALANHLASESEVLRSLVARVEQLRQERASLTARYREQHPKVIRLDAEIASVDQQIRDQVDRLVEAREAELEVARQREAALGTELERLKSEVQALEDQLVELQELEANAERDESFYESLNTRLSEVDLSELIKANNVDIVDAALPGDTPVRPKMPVNLAMALVVGLVGGGAMAFFTEYLDNTVKSRDDVEQVIGLPFAGVVPLVDAQERERLAQERKHGVYVAAMPRSTVAECLRTIRTNLLFNAGKRPIRRLLVTSAVPREGKSFIASNLAAIIAMTGQRVLLIDGDLRRPSMHKVFGTPNDLGLSNVLLGEATLAVATLRTEVPTLDVLPAGPTPPNPSELLGGGRMEALLDSLTDYDMVVVDSPPVNVVADPLVLSTMADGVIVVIEANRTKKNMVLQARSRLEEMRANVMGSVVNKLNIRRAGYGYYYYYYDADYAYYEDPAPEAAREAGA